MLDLFFNDFGLLEILLDYEEEKSVGVIISLDLIGHF